VPKKSPAADFSRQSRKKIANCDIGDRQSDLCIQYQFNTCYFNIFFNFKQNIWKKDMKSLKPLDIALDMISTFEF
jgi:hypothetical protein